MGLALAFLCAIAAPSAAAAGPCAEGGVLDREALTGTQLDALRGLGLEWSDESEGWVTKVKGGGTSPAEPTEIEAARKELCKSQAAKSAVEVKAADKNADALAAHFGKGVDQKAGLFSESAVEQYDALMAGPASEEKKAAVKVAYRDGLVEAMAQCRAVGKPTDDLETLYRGSEEEKEAFDKIVTAKSQELKQKGWKPKPVAATPVFDGKKPAAPAAAPQGCASWCASYSANNCADLFGIAACDNLNREITAHHCVCDP